MAASILGLDELVSALASEGKETERRASNAVGRVAQMVKSTAIELAPKGDRPHEGPKIAESMTITGQGTRREVGPTARHGAFMEYGTYKDAPQPYMGPAADMHEDALVNELWREVGEL